MAVVCTPVVYVTLKTPVMLVTYLMGSRDLNMEAT
jgi:hypothetical protein